MKAPTIMSTLMMMAITLMVLPLVFFGYLFMPIIPRTRPTRTAQDRKDKGANSKGVIRPDRLRHMFHIHFLKILVKYGYDINLFPHVQRNNVLA